MSKFLKTCFSCGSKVKTVYEGFCIDCFREQYPPIKEIKPVKFKVCNISGKIAYKNTFYPEKELFERLPNIMKNYVVIDDNYKLEEIKVENVEVVGHKLSFDVVAECDIGK